MPKEFGFGREYRISDTKDIRQIYKYGKILRAESFEIKYVKNGLSISRICFSVNRKLASAPKRNRAKRLLRELFRLNKKKIPCGYDFLIIFKKEIIGKTFKALEKEFLELLANEKFFKE